MPLMYNNGQSIHYKNILQENYLGRLHGLDGSAGTKLPLPEFESRVGIYEGYFIFDFSSLPLEFARPI